MWQQPLHSSWGAPAAKTETCSVSTPDRVVCTRLRADSKWKGKTLCGQKCCERKWWLKMNLEFLENVCQVLPSLLRYVDKRDEADEMLTAALPLNTLAQPNAAAQTHPHSTHWLCTLHTREETDLFVLANKFTPSRTDIGLFNHT